jgi:hypothetical protein
MKLMKRIPYEIELDVFPIPTRFCRFYQERIYDYYDDGRPRFEWEYMKQNYSLKVDQAIEKVCDSCHLNLLLGVEGCKGELYEFESFVKMISNVKPDSPLVTKGVLDSIYNEEETKQLVSDMENLQESGKDITWPVAQIFIGDKPAIFEGSTKFNQMVYFEWNGDDDLTYFHANAGYMIAVSNRGIMLRKVLGDPVPDEFVSLARRGMRVIGNTTMGKIISIPINRAVLPDWWPENPGVDCELKFASMPISDLYWDIFNMIIIFGKTALKYKTGMCIFSKFYRPQYKIQ